MTEEASGNTTGSDTLPRARQGGPSMRGMRSMSHRLLRDVFSIYFAVTVCIFAVDVALKVREQLQAVRVELQILQESSRGSLEHNLWNMTRQPIVALAEGMLKIPSVGEVSVIEPGGQAIIQLRGARGDLRLDWWPGADIELKHPISRMHDGRQVPLGWLVLRSGGLVVWERLQASLTFLLVSAAAKTALLILLMKWFFDRRLSRPLLDIARRASAIDPKRPGAAPLPVGVGAPSELDVISMVINGLAREVDGTVVELDRLNRSLEEQVQARTGELRVTVQALADERVGLKQEVELRRAREAELEAANRSLAQLIEQLNRTHASLLEAEKLASLGGLVAGVAHEINTPVGLGLTGASHFVHMLDQIELRLREGTLERPEFERFLSEARELAQSVLSSLTRAAELVRSFKLVAVDQGHDERRLFLLREYLDSVLLTHRPALKQQGVAVEVKIADALQLDSYPAAWAQLLSNLVTNSLLHGLRALPPTAPRLIRVAARAEGHELCLVYSDNGVGMSAEVAKRIYEPFFTTNREGGGSGLGMNIVYNLVTQRLQGRLHLSTSPGEGVAFTVRVPLRLADAHKTGR